MDEYIDIDQPLIFKDVRNRDVTGTIRTILRANHTELVLADVAPVRHGRWERPNSRPRSYMYKCSECREISFYLKHENCKYRYCPWCGAKMEDES